VWDGHTNSKEADSVFVSNTVETCLSAPQERSRERDGQHHSTARDVHALVTGEVG
jgi:hypothetical protein